VIEKRYRNNLNDKIAALRDSVPSLRIMARRLEHAAQSSDDAADGADDDRENEDLSGLTPAHKLNKATILSKATEYISHLERRNKNLSRENAALRDRVEGFEMMVMSRGRPGSTWT
jgi:outer membrane scaffolding protein for murein synthesis (MipA/OmpV family)